MKEKEQTITVTEEDKKFVRALVEAPKDKKILVQGFMLGLGLEDVEAQKGA